MLGAQRIYAEAGGGRRPGLIRTTHSWKTASGLVVERHDFLKGIVPGDRRLMRVPGRLSCSLFAAVGGFLSGTHLRMVVFF
jgi:hypothetical protein